MSDNRFKDSIDGNAVIFFVNAAFRKKPKGLRIPAKWVKSRKEMERIDPYMFDELGKMSSPDLRDAFFVAAEFGWDWSANKLYFIREGDTLMNWIYKYGKKNENLLLAYASNKID